MTQTEVQQGHPKGLYTLFFTEMWERFSYYGMRALLVLYLVNKIGFERSDALEIYGIFTGLVYLTPLLGGFLADKVLGHRKAIFIGGILMALGQFALAASPDFLNLGLGLIIMGNGFFKPNISTIVGSLYSENDPRKDSAFTIFYMGINLGAFLSPLVCGTLGEQVGWSYGFAAAGCGMLLGVIWFHFQGHSLGEAGYPPGRAEKKLFARDWFEIIAYIIANAIFVWGALSIWGSLTDEVRTTIMYVLGIGGLLGLIYIIYTNTSGGDQWSRVWVILILCFFNVYFWAGFEQAGGTFNLFADTNTDRVVFGSEIPAAYFQSVNAIMIFALAPVFSTLWIALGRINKNPNIPVKFGMALIFIALGFVVMSMAEGATAGGSVKVSPMWLIMVYLLHTVGELCLSPIGLSMISKLSPPKITAVMMGVWFGSIALANYMAGILETLLHKFDLNLFTFLVISSAAAGLALLLISPILKRMMKGIV
ncbi:MAG: peptide MFS transporter [Bacteroidota bacterium]